MAPPDAWSSIRKPNFFLVGMPRSGTTSIYHYLYNHPEIFMSPVKEPNYFHPDIRHPSEENYALLFSKVKNEAVIGEASVNYLLSRKAMEDIHRFNPNTKLLVMLRQPVDYLHALHFANCQMGFIDQRLHDFRHHMRAERLLTKQQPLGGFIHNKLFVPLNNLKFAQDLFGRSRIHVIVLEDFIRNKRTVFKGLLEFLEVSDTNFVPDFVRYNSLQEGSRGFVYRSFYLSKQIFYWKTILRRFHVPYPIVAMAAGSIEFLNKRRVGRPPLAPSFRQELTTYLEPYIQEVERILNRNLDIWRETGRESQQVEPANTPGSNRLYR